MIRHLDSQHGFSLIEVMIAAGIMLTVMLGFASMLNSQNQMSKLIAQKMELVTLKQTLLSLSNTPAICRCQLDNTINTSNSSPLTINGNNLANQEIVLDSVHSSCDLTQLPIASSGQSLQGTQTALKVSSIKLKDIHPLTGVADSWLGTLAVTIDPTSEVQSLHPVEIPLNIGTDPSSPAGTLRIQSCSGLSSGSGTQAPIVCRKLGNIFRDAAGTATPAPGVGTQTISFAPGDCGGALPDPSYIGMFSKMFVCGVSSQWTITQPTDGTPGFSMYTLADCVAPYASADVQVVFIHK